MPHPIKAPKLLMNTGPTQPVHRRVADLAAGIFQGEIDRWIVRKDDRGRWRMEDQLGIGMTGWLEAHGPHATIMRCQIDHGGRFGSHRHASEERVIVLSGSMEIDGMGVFGPGEISRPIAAKTMHSGTIAPHTELLVIWTPCHAIEWIGGDGHE